MEVETPHATRLSLFYILSLTAGVAIAISIARGIEQLRFPVDYFYGNAKTIRNISALDALIASLYGVCLTTFIFAWRSGNLWNSPGKILSLLLAVMCLLNWTLDLFAAGLMNYRMLVGIPESERDTSPIIIGIHYREFAPMLGYVLALPIAALVIYKTRHQRISWRIVWVGFFIATFLIAGLFHFHFNLYLPRPIRSWYFQIAIGIPVVLIACGLLIDLSRRERLDWWTLITGPMIIAVWGIMIAQRLF